MLLLLGILFISLLQRARHLEYIAANLPSVSPLSKEWPKSPPYMKTQISGIKRIFHKWRVRGGTKVQGQFWHEITGARVAHFQCHQYRLRFDQISRNRMREKVTASIIFKDRKASYPRR